MAAGLDVAGDSAKEGGRRLAEKVLDAMPIELEDVVWEEALGGSADKEAADTEGGEDADPAAAAAARSSEVGIDRVWEAALSQGSASADQEAGEGDEEEGDEEEEQEEEEEEEEEGSGGEADEIPSGTAAETAARGLVGGEKAAPGRARQEQGGKLPVRRPNRPTSTVTVQPDKKAAGEEVAQRREEASKLEMSVSGDGERGDDDNDEPGESDAASSSSGAGAGAGAGAEEGQEELVGAPALAPPTVSPLEAGASASLIGESHSDSEGGETDAETDTETEDVVPPDGAQETILSEFVSIGGGEGMPLPNGKGGSLPGSPAGADTGGGVTGEGEALHLRKSSEEQRRVVAAAGGEAGEGAPQDAGEVLGMGSGDQMPGFREVGGVGVAGWSKDSADGKEADGQPRAGGDWVDGEEIEDEEEEEEEEQEWVVKMQELHAKFQTRCACAAFF